MKMERYLFGKLNNEIKQREYHGESTDTAETIVDNANNTIKVNVDLTIEDKGDYIELSFKGNHYKFVKYEQ